MRTSRGIVCAAWALATAISAQVTAEPIPGIFDAPWLGFDLGDYEQAGYPHGGTVNDFDGDGDLDVAVATTTSFPEVSVLLNNGDGTLGQPTHYVLAKASHYIASADFDGDKDIDLVASNMGVNWEGNTVSLYRNNGDGTFQAQQQFSVGTGSAGAAGIAFADFDLDRDLDLAVTKYGFLGQGTTVALLNNNGDGTFAAPLSFLVGNAPLAVVAAHLNGDAYPDLAITGQASANLGRVSILMNNATGGFAAPVHYNAIFTAGPTDSDVAASDIDLDGDIDLVYGDGGMHSGNGFEFPFAVAVYRNQGNGTFAAPQALPLGDFTGGMFELAVADLTEDGWPDIFGSHNSNGGWSVIPSTGNGQFGPYQKHSSGEYPRDVLAADMDKDGDVDPVIVNTYSINVNVHFNPGNGDFSAQHHPIASVFSEIDLADVDADGDIDIGVAFFNLLDGGGVQIVKNNGSGAFVPAFTYPSPTIEYFDPHFADLTSDGLPDLIYANWETAPPYTFRWRINQGNGSLGPESIGPGAAATCGTSDIQPADLDNDGDFDIVMTEWLACINIPTSARRVFIVENTGTPQSPAFALDEIIVVSPGPGGVTIGDFNHDTIPDLAVTSQPINLLIGLGNLNYSIVQLSQAPSIPIVNADFNNDTHLDLAVGIVENTSFSPGLGILLGHGDGTFQPVVQYPGSYSPDLAQISEIAAFDADDDGDADVLAANYASNDISLWANNGDGTFAPQIRYGVGLESPGDLGFADLNGDAIHDLAVPVGIIPGYLGRVVILPGQAAAPIVGDITRDGVVDIDDLFEVIGAWGECPDPPVLCPADLDQNGTVDIDDLFLVIENWTS